MLAITSPFSLLTSHFIWKTLLHLRQLAVTRIGSEGLVEYLAGAVDVATLDGGIGETHLQGGARSGIVDGAIKPADRQRRFSES